MWRRTSDAVKVLQDLNAANVELVVRMQTAEEIRDESGKVQKLQMVLELGETDFNHILDHFGKGNPIPANYARLYWEQMLQAVQSIHAQNVVHSDLKPANFIRTSPDWRPPMRCWTGGSAKRSSSCTRVKYCEYTALHQV